MKRWIAVVIVVFFLIGAATYNRWKPAPRPVKHPPNNDPWKLVSYDPDNPYGTYLGNGFISTRVMGDGVGTKCYMAGLYDNEKLIPTPNWADVGVWDSSRKYFEIDKQAAYCQTLNMKTGVLTTRATWRAGGKSLKGTLEIVVSRDTPSLALIHTRLTPDFDGQVFVGHVLPKSDQMTKTDGYLDIRSPDKAEGGDVLKTRQSGICLAVASRLPGRSAFAVKPPWRVVGLVSDGPFVAVTAKAGRAFSVSEYIAVCRGDEPEETLERAKQVLAYADSLGYEAVTAKHKAAWAKLWQKDIIIDGPAKDQQAIHSCTFYLLQSVREGSQWSIPPMGLSNDAFSGHVFWDADVWIFPSLILQHPELARSIVDYRYNTLPGAIANAKEHGFKGAEYAWESGYTGREDTPEGLSYRYERHINGDVALAQWQYYLATGDNNWLETRGFPVLRATADYWVSRATYNAAKQRYEILKVVPPDENAEIINNSVYTNAIVKMNLEFAVKAAGIVGAAPNPRWSEVAGKMYIPFDSKAKRFIPFDGYKGYEAKQADTELMIYPLQFKFPGQDMTEIYKSTFEYYQPKVMKNGPAMSSSAHAVIAARLGDCASAYKYWQDSWAPFVRGPFNYFNEKRSKTWDQMCFLTGAAGPVQSAVFGLAGVQMDYNSVPSELTFKPCLPKQWKSLKITGIQWKGKTFDLVAKPGQKPLLKTQN